MLKRILFPVSNRAHLARQQLLISKLMNDFELHICNYGNNDMSMSEIACDIAPKFKKALDKVKPDLVIIRADRAEMLPMAMISTYDGYKVAQLEAGDRSGVVDDKVRFAISFLSDYHFATNSESEERLLKMGFKDIWNVGSLDVEYALTVEGQNQTERLYLLVLYHIVPLESFDEVLGALKAFPEYDIIGVRGNKDYGKSPYTEQYKPDEFIRLLKGASCLVGNSSCGLKECSILGVPVVNIGSRQANRLRTWNIEDCSCEKEKIEEAIRTQLKHGKYERDDTYYQQNTAEKICNILKTIV